VDALTGLPHLEGAAVERWFAQRGHPPRLDLARSGAAPMTVGELLAVGGEESVEALLGMSLDYGDGGGDERLRQAVAGTGSTRRASEVLITHGAVEAILLACAAAAGDGGEAIVATPAYGALTEAPRAVGLKVRAVAVWEPGSNRLCLDGVIAAVTPATRAVLINSPHNPTGLRASVAQIDTLARRCAATGAVLIVDEVARGTLRPEARSATATAAYEEGAMIVCGDVSKAMGLGGLRVGWLTTANRALLSRAAGLKDLTSLANARPTQLLAAVALENRERVMARTVAWASSNRATVAEVVRRCRGAWVPPDDGLVAFPLLPLPRHAGAFADDLRRRHGVAVVPGSLFGVPGRLRLGLGCRPSDFRAGALRLTQALGAA
jgi:aspartate/methionine/tyrosine aminotransferase